MKRLLLILVAAMSLCACGEDEIASGDENANYKTGEYMSAFFTPQKVYIRNKIADGHLYISLLDTAIFDTDCDCFGTLSKLDYVYTNWDTPNYTKYKEYVNYYGDSTYSGPGYRPIACIYPISKIDITADKDFDEYHPANASLNDIFNWYGSCFYDFIKNGYKCDGAENLGMPVADIELSDFRNINLPEYYFGLIFKQQPATPGTYTFTVSVTFDPDPVTGKTISLEPATTTITFE